MRRVLVLALLAALATAGVAVPIGAQTIPSTTAPPTTAPPTTAPPTTAPPVPALTVKGSVACTSSSTFTITWSLANTSTTTVEFMGGVMSGAAKGAVELSPSVISPGQTMKGVATVPGATKGVVDIAVSTLIGNVGPADYSGSVRLDGSCVPASPAPATRAPATFTG